jgi:hypothetical protein
MSAAEEQLITALQRRLHTSGPLPKREIISAAVAMARNPSLETATACDNAKVPRGSRDRASKFSERIKREDLLAACAPLELRPEPQPAQQPPPVEALEAPICEHCRSNCRLVKFIWEQNAWSCDKCDDELPLGTYWACGQCYDGYSLCHTCTAPSATPPCWDSVPHEHVIGRIPELGLHTQEECDAYFEKLTIDNHFGEDSPRDAPDAVVQAELQLAKALQLPHHPPAAGIYSQYFSQLLVSEQWISSHTPNIWRLTLEPLTLSADGKRATRELCAELKLSAEDRHGLDWFGSIDRDVHDEIVYDMPPTAAECKTQIFARERHIEKMRQREIAVLRRLDGDAAIEHRERKAQMAFVRSVR